MTRKPPVTPKCGFAHWPVPVPRHVRFHDLRHTTATLLLKAGVPIATVQRLLRHSDPSITSEIYGHLDVEDMRAAVNRLAFEGMPLPVVAEESAVAAVTADGTRPVEDRGAPVVRTAAKEKEEGRGPLGFPSDSAPFQWSGRQDLNLRPLGPEHPSAHAQPLASVHKLHQSKGFREEPPVQPLPANAAVRSPFVTRFVTRPPDETPLSAPVRAAPERLLTVAEVATFLGVSRATVYALVERGDLAHVRVTNSIRIRPADAAAFIAQGGSR